MTFSRLIPALLCVVVVGALGGENWPQWRGPAFNGSSNETGLPATFSKTENVVWTAPMPGLSGATPAIWDDKVFVSSADAKNKDLLAICINRKDGKELWRNVVAPSADYRPQNGRNNMASPSPITDGKLVIFFYGTGDLAAFDMDGKELWKRSLAKDFGKFAIMWGYGSSGLLYKDKLYIPVLQRDKNVYSPGADKTASVDSYLLAMDPKTGKDLWKVARACDGVEETREWYGTPMPLATKDRSELILIGGDNVTAHDPETGKELWRFGGWNPTKVNHVRLVPSAAAYDGLVYVATPKHMFPFFALKGGGSGDITSAGPAWTLDKGMSPDVCTPLVYKDLLYVFDGDGAKRMLRCIDPKTGALKWEGQIPGKVTFWASAHAADGKIYCIDEASNVTVAQAGPEGFKVLHTTNLGDTKCFASIAIAQKQIFIRTGENLYCIGSK